MLTEDVPVVALLPHIPFLLQYCRDLINNSSSRQAQNCAKKAATLVSRLLAVLSKQEVQERLGGQQSVQPHSTLLESALHTFTAAAGVEPHPSATGEAQSPTGLEAAHAAGGPLTMHPAAVQAPGSSQLHFTSMGAAAGMTLEALLFAMGPCTSHDSGRFPPDLPLLLAQWARLVYGELAEQSSIQVAALLQCHWRTLLRFLRLCLHGTAVLGAGQGPMEVSTAVRLVGGLLQLLEFDSVRALFTQPQYQQVVSHLSAMQTILQGLPQTSAGHAASVCDFSSAAVAALAEAPGMEASGLHGEPASTAAVSAVPSAQPIPMQTAAALPAEAGSAHSGSSTQLQQLLSLVSSVMDAAGPFSPQERDAMQRVIAALCQRACENGS
jgi:hypothetical protein